MFSLPVLEHQLVMYVTSEGRDTFAQPFDLSNVPVVTREQAYAEERTKKLTTATPTLKAPSAGPRQPAKPTTDTVAAATAAAQKYSAALSAVPEIAAYGNVLKSSQVVELTESETEYVVSAIKHVFESAIVLQYDIKNTLPNTVLTDVSIVCAPSDSDEPQLEEDFLVPIPRLDTDVPGTAYVAFKRLDPDTPALATSFTNILKFTSKEIDPSTGEPEETGYEDEYQVEDLDLTGADFILPAYAGSFDNIWSQLEQSGGDEASETLQLSNMKSISEATESLIKTLNMQPLDGTDVALSTSTHTLKVFGKSVKGGKVAANVRMAFSAKTGVTMKIVVRSEEESVATLVVAGVS